ncbi:MAG: beta strand repeat-containing protein, partial [Pyrinomonadaceae bacterium]
MFRLFLSKRLFSAIFITALLLLTFFYRGDHVSTKNNSPTLVAPITVTKNAPMLSTDTNGNGVVNPGDTLTYTVTVSNGATDATGVIFTDVLDSNLTLVPGSVNSSPIAVNESYNVLGNVSISVPLANGVKANDLDPDGTTPTITGFGNSLANANANAPGNAATSASGGNVTLNTDGSFTYNPPPGFDGADSFFYTLSDGAATDTAQVTLNISGMIWFIKNDAASCTTLAAGCGRLSNPFSSLSSFASINNGAGNNPAAGDNIFIYTGSGSYDASLTLLNNQKLIGQGATASLQLISGVTVASFSATLPSTGGTNPTLISTTANAVNPGSGNTLRGLTIGNTTGSKLNALASVGTLTVGPATGTSDVTLNGTGRALNLAGGGTLAARFASISASGGTNGIVLTGMGGNLESPTTTIQNSTGTGVSVSNSVTGGTFNFGNTTTTGTAGTGVLLSGNANSLTFSVLNLTPNSGQRGLQATNNTGTITTTSGTISTTNGVAVEIVGTSAASRTPLNMQLTSVSANGGVNGILVQNASDGGNGFRVLGTGTTDGSGGTIQNITNRGASFIDAADIQLNNMTLNNVGTVNGADPTNAASTCGDINQIGTNAGCAAGIHAGNVTVGLALTNIDMNGGAQQGINGDNVTNFTLNNSNVLNFGDQVRESGVKINNLLGTSSIMNTLVRGNEERQIEVQNDSGTLTNFTVSSVTVQGSAVPNGAQGLLFSGSGTANMKLTVTNSTFGGPNAADQLRSTCIQTDVQGGSPTMDVTVTGSTFQEGGAALGAAAIDIIQAFSGNVRFNVSNNPTFLNLGSHVININQQTTSTNGSLLQGQITSNTIGNTVSGTSGTVAGSGVRIRSLGQGTTIANVLNNTIRGVTERGIFAELAEGTTVNNTLHVTITNNFVNLTDASADRGILVHAGIATTADDGVACADIANNNATSAGVTGDGIRVRQREKADLQMPGYTGGLTDSAAVISYLTPRNPATTDTFSGSAVPVGDATAGFKNTPGGAGCIQPSIPLAPESVVFGEVKGTNFNNPFFASLLLAQPYQPRSESVTNRSARASDATVSASDGNVSASYATDSASDATVSASDGNVSASDTTVSASYATVSASNATVSGLKGSVSASSGNSSLVEALSEIARRLAVAISPTVYSQEKNEKAAPEAGETVCVDGDTNPACTGAGFTLAANESTTITFRAAVNSNSTATSIPNTANVTAAGGINQNSNTVNTTVVQPASISKSFGATNIALNGSTSLTFTIANPNPSQSLSQIAFTDPLPSGLVVATPNGLVNNCGGTVTATVGSGSISLSNGSRAAGANCTITVNVTGTTEGAKNNTT